VASALAGELESMAGWLGLADVAVGERGDLAGELSKAIARR
ncbi:MAG: winged helix-turn-helix domain-containing protein, partial [Mycobacterium sp.]